MNEPIEILLVEDDEGDARLTLEAFKDAKVLNRVSVVSDGAAAMDYLNQRGDYAQARRPDVILLDLNLPRLSGHEVLTRVKGDPKLATIPIVILTTSDAEADVQRSYSLHANCYVTKPVDFDRFIEVVRAIDDFWLAVVRLPPKDPRRPDF